MPSRRTRDRRRRLSLVTALAAACCLLAACGGGGKSVSQTPAPTVAISAQQVSATPAIGTPAASGSAAPTEAAAPAQTSAPPSATAPARPSPFPTATLPPPQDAAPCRDGQLKGDNSTKTFYLPGMPQYSPLHANVQCFNTIEQAQGAGFHLPGQGG